MRWRRNTPASSGAAGVLLLLALAACSRGTAVSRDSVLLQRLEPDAARAQEASGAFPVALRLDAAQSDDWVIESPKYARESAPGRLLLQGKGLKTVTIPGRFDPTSFTRLRLLLASKRRGRVRAGFLRAGEVAASSAPTLVLPSEEPRALELDLPETAAESALYDGLRLELDLSSSFSIVAIELVQRPLRSWLPSPSGPAELVSIGADARRAWGLSTEEPLSMPFTPTGQATLRFAVGRPPDLPRRPERQVVRVRVEGDAQTLVEREIDLPRAGATPWREVSLPLDLPPGTAATVHFSTSAEHGSTDLCALAQPVVVHASARPLTVLLVTSDTHRADHFAGARSPADVRTPSLDALARRGVVFEDCYSTSNITIPSHVALMTATSPRDTGLVNNVSRLMDEAHTLAEVFAEQGFMTLGVLSSAHLAHELSGLGQGFDRLAVPSTATRDAAESVTTLERWLDDAPETPLFVWLHLFDAHGPYEPPGEYDRMYYTEDRDPFDASLPPLPEDEQLPRWLRGLRDHEFARSQYRAEVTYLDAQLGRVLEHPRVVSGIVAVTADHGEIFERKGVLYEHRGVFPETLHVPLVLSYPGVEAGTRVASSVNQLDLGRTLLDRAGLEDVAFPGRSLLEPHAEPRFAIGSGARVASITHEGWHLILRLRSPHENRQHMVELYDIEEDPACLEDLADAEPERAAKLRRRLVAWIAERRTTGLATRAELSPADLERLAALGYTSGDLEDEDASWDVVDCHCARCESYR